MSCLVMLGAANAATVTDMEGMNVRENHCRSERPDDRPLGYYGG